MRYTWNTSSRWWTHVMRVVLVAVVLGVAACAMLGGASAPPAGQPREGGQTGPRVPSGY
jgi:hypothetical protein